MRKLLSEIVIILGTLFIYFFWVVYWVGNILDTVFQDAKDNIVVTWETPEQVGRALVWWWDWKITRIANLLLQINIAIWAAMFLYGWISLMSSYWDESKMRQSRNKLFIAWSWVMLSLWSGATLQLMKSLSTTVAWW